MKYRKVGSVREQPFDHVEHRPGYSVPLEGHLPEDMKVSLIPEANGWDEPIFSVRLERDGWVLHQAATKRQVNPRYWVIEKPEIRIRTDPSNKYKIWMIRKPGYRDESFRIKDIEGTDVLNLNARHGQIGIKMGDLY